MNSSELPSRQERLQISGVRTWLQIRRQVLNQYLIFIYKSLYFI
jgi:hypothetical protein